MSGGGTGGHIFPAVAIAQEIKKRFPDAEFLFIGANGKMEMEIQRYLDSFPFEFLVVLRDVDTLPDVLSGILKQFFERMTEVA